MVANVRPIQKGDLVNEPSSGGKLTRSPDTMPVVTYASVCSSPSNGYRYGATKSLEISSTLKRADTGKYALNIEKGLRSDKSQHLVTENSIKDEDVRTPEICENARPSLIVNNVDGVWNKPLHTVFIETGNDEEPLPSSIEAVKLLSYTEDETNPTDLKVSYNGLKDGNTTKDNKCDQKMKRSNSMLSVASKQPLSNNMIMENGFCSYPITQQMQSNGRIRFVKIPDNDKYGHYDSLSTRYSDAEDDQLCSHSLAVKFDSLSESMLKQLDTPTMRPALGSLSEMDEYSLNEQPKTTHNEHNGSINTTEGIYTLNGKIPYDNVSQSRSYSNTYMQNIEGNNGDSINYFQDVVNSAYYNIGIEGNLMFRREVPDNKPVRRYNTSYCNAVNLSSGQYQNDANRTLRPGELNTELLCYDSLNVSTLINNTDEHIAGNIAIIAKDQTGCRLLQKMLETEDYLVVETILEGVMDNLVDLMMDPFGNYLCQKLITVCSTQQIDAIIDVAGPMLIDISLNMHGTRTLQRLIEVLHEPKQIAKVTKLLSPSVETLVTDINGNHVIQKCLSVLPPEDCEFIHQAILKKSLMFATHRHGCCVIQRCIDAANTRQRDELVETLIEHTLELIQDPFGNYVVQYILKLKNMDVNARIVKAVAPKATLYAKHKFSSNVIEKCLILTHTRIRNILVEKFVKAPYDTLKDLMLHPFGNYVIQRVLSVAQRSDLDELLKRMRPHIDELRTMSTGKRIAAKITKKHMNSDVPNTKQNGVAHKTNMLGIFNRCDTDDLTAELLRLSNAEKVGSIDMDQVNQESNNGQESDVKPPTYSGQQPILTKKDRFSKTGPSIEMLEALFKRALAVQPNRLS